jgi:tetratricopeptide (TPR) repeat protein
MMLLRDAADEAIKGGAWQQARDLINRALALAPQEASSRYRMAVVLSQQGEALSALEFTKGLIDEGELNEVVLYQHARALVLAGRHGEAEPLLDGLQAHATLLPEFDYFHIRALHAVGKLDEAIAKASSMEDDPIAQGMLSLLYIDADRLDAGQALAQQILARDPHNVDALLAAGTGLLAMEKSDAALPAFNEVVRQHPDSGRAWMGIGLARLSAGDLDGAREALAKTVALLPSHLGSWNALAWVQMIQRDHAGASQTLDTALNINRNFGETHGTIAVLKAARQEWADAEHHAEVAVRLQPESFAGRFAQTLVLEHRGRPEQAALLLENMMRNYSAPAGGNLIDLVHRYAARGVPGKPGGDIKVTGQRQS